MTEEDHASLGSLTAQPEIGKKETLAEFDYFN